MLYGLNSLHDWGFVSLGPLNNFAGRSISGDGRCLARSLTVQLQQLGGVEPRLLHHLHLPDVNIVEGVDSLASFLNRMQISKLLKSVCTRR